MPITNEAGSTVITGDSISFFRILTLRSGLKLEILGMKRHGRSCYAIIKDEFGFTGNKAKVLAQLQEWITANYPTPESAQ